MLYEVKGMLISLAVVIILQYIHISKHAVHLQYTQFLLVSYIPRKLGGRIISVTILREIQRSLFGLTQKLGCSLREPPKDKK